VASTPQLFPLLFQRALREAPHFFATHSPPRIIPNTFFCRGINRSVTTAAVFLTFCGAVQAFEEGVERIRRVRVQAGPLPQYIEWGKKYCEAGFKCV
jgi:hypothetical protein